MRNQRVPCPLAGDKPCADCRLFDAKVDDCALVGSSAPAAMAPAAPKAPKPPKPEKKKAAATTKKSWG